MITFTNVTKKYGDNIGLENASVSIAKGDFVFLVGPSGAGSSRCPVLFGYTVVRWKFRWERDGVGPR